MLIVWVGVGGYIGNEGLRMRELRLVEEMR